ncbi:unnamed protein product [Victoria cruziana]
MASPSFPFLALPSPCSDSPSFWTICPFCQCAHEYLRKYESLDLWCQLCRRVFRAIPMVSAPPIVPGTESYYFWPFGYGGPPWWPFCPPPPPPVAPYVPPIPAHVTPPEHQTPSTTTQKPHAALPVSDVYGADSSHKLVFGSKKKSGESEVSSRKKDHLVNQDPVRTETRSELDATRTSSRVQALQNYAIGTEPKVKRSRSGSVCQLVDQDGGQRCDSTKASEIQGNLSGNMKTLLVKKARMEILKNLPEQHEMETASRPAGNGLTCSLATARTSATAVALNGRKDRQRRKIPNRKFVKSMKSGRGWEGIKSAVSEKEEPSDYEIISSDPELEGLHETIQGVSGDIAAPEKFEESFPSSSVVDVPDSDFYDFDLDRNVSSFEGGQIWAIYDEADGMPRIYALIHKVISRNPFFVQLAWLQPVTSMNSSCGQFKIGKGTSCDIVNLFSHRVTRVFSSFTGDIRIHPNKHQVWAVSYLANEHASRYQIVEILNEYTEEHGVSFISLAKVSGYRCLYQKLQEGLGGFASMWSLSKEDLHKFSHQIPASKIAHDIPDLPQDCWELDPAAIPNCLL